MSPPLRAARHGSDPRRWGARPRKRPRKEIWQCTTRTSRAFAKHSRPTGSEWPRPRPIHGHEAAEALTAELGREETLEKALEVALAPGPPPSPDEIGYSDPRWAATAVVFFLAGDHELDRVLNEGLAEVDAGRVDDADRRRAIRTLVACLCARLGRPLPDGIEKACPQLVDVLLGSAVGSLLLQIQDGGTTDWEPGKASGATPHGV